MKNNTKSRELYLPDGQKIELFDMAMYRGDVMRRCLEGEDKLVIENEYFVYDILKDKFISLNTNSLLYTYSILFDSDKMTKEEELDYTKKYNESLLEARLPSQDGQLYLNPFSLELLGKQEKKKKNK